MNPKCWEKTKRDIITHKYDHCLDGEEWIINQVLEKLKNGGGDISTVDIPCS
jgi:hypothetical protein